MMYCPYCNEEIDEDFDIEWTHIDCDNYEIDGSWTNWYHGECSECGKTIRRMIKYGITKDCVTKMEE